MADGRNQCGSSLEEGILATGNGFAGAKLRFPFLPEIMLFRQEGHFDFQRGHFADFLNFPLLGRTIKVAEFCEELDQIALLLEIRPDGEALVGGELKGFRQSGQPPLAMPFPIRFRRRGR